MSKRVVHGKFARALAKRVERVARRRHNDAKRQIAHRHIVVAHRGHAQLRLAIVDPVDVEKDAPAFSDAIDIDLLESRLAPRHRVYDKLHQQVFKSGATRPLAPRRRRHDAKAKRPRRDVCPHEIIRRPVARLGGAAATRKSPQCRAHGRSQQSKHKRFQIPQHVDFAFRPASGLKPV